MPTRLKYSIYEFHAGKINNLIQKELSDIAKTTERQKEANKQTKQEVFQF